MELRQLEQAFSVCKLSALDGIPMSGEFVFLSKTDEEISLVCETASVPENVTEARHGWRCLKIEGVLDFGLVGIIAGISTILAEQQISVFVVSTYNTDYILVKEEHCMRAVGLLRERGYTIP